MLFQAPIVNWIVVHHQIQNGLLFKQKKKLILGLCLKHYEKNWKYKKKIGRHFLVCCWKMNCTFRKRKVFLKMKMVQQRLCIGGGRSIYSRNLCCAHIQVEISTMKQHIFNCRLSRARRMIECTCGILSNNCRILHRPAL